MDESLYFKPLIVTAIAVTALLVGGLQAEQGPSERGPLRAMTQPLSPSVLATVATRNQVLELAVLWRGAPGWFLAGSGRGASYSEGNATFSAALNYGGLQLSLSYEPSRHSRDRARRFRRETACRRAWRRSLPRDPGRRP